MDSWKSPFIVKVILNFLNNHYYDYFSKLINNRTFIPATQGVNKKQIVQEEHKIQGFTISAMASDGVAGEPPIQDFLWTNVLFMDQPLPW